MSFEQLNEYINENIHANDDNIAYNWFINHCKVKKWEKAEKQ